MIATIAWLGLTLISADPLSPGDHVRTVESDGREREYLVHVPPKYDGDQPTPVVLVFHGGASNPDQMMRYTAMNDKADAEGFIVVYPSGSGRTDRILTFNGGNCCGYAMNRRVDDVGFVRTLLDDLTTVAKVDPKRVYATGMSNGAIMCYRLAAELSDRIAAIAPVAGPMGSETCKPTRPVPVIHFHGTNDQFAPFDGGKGDKSVSQTDFYSVDHSIQNWVKANGCPSTPAIEALPDSADDGMTSEKRVYGPGKQGSEVVLVAIKGGDHTWPGREARLRFLGKSTKDFSANDLMWEFFEKHPMP